MIQISAAANSATPTNSLTRRDTFDPPKSDLHDDGEHERPSSRAFAKEAAQLHAHLCLDQPLIGAFLDAGLLHDLGEHARGVGEQGLAVLHDETARYQTPHALDPAG